MTRLTDGKKTVEITMRTWENGNYTPDWSNDFFSVGSLKMDWEKDAYIVDDVDYCVEYACEWEEGVGDFYDEHDEPDVVNKNRYVYYKEV